ncbi:hypothetical protein [Vibrio sp. 1288]|uniref:hypothetical protein n=1 Tax=Vibrio sp. 1288 TaxID=3074550 RepID=UPI002966228C|nr:hypothetical protein [Vibrio sp. 1288]MDW3136306.1 hypothetical protein [Vibrio sp. 1288]
MNKYTKTLLATVITTSLAACGGGGSGGNNDEGARATVSGKVIDGYISGATVFLDLNFNGKLDEGEPSAITGKDGGFDLEIGSSLSECSQYVPTVTHVPVGAIDSDFPDKPIEKAYTMVSPPSFAMSTDEELLNLTPLTSIVWDSVEKELASAGTELNCESILAREQLQEEIVMRLEQQELRVAQRYNVTVDELYSDYAESGDEELHQLAQDLVPGLQASYAETLELEQAHPDANYVFVEYFLGMQQEDSNEYDDNWYRREFVQATRGNWIDIIDAMSRDLATNLANYSITSQLTRFTDDIEYEEMVHLNPTVNWTPDSPEQSCGINETYLQRGNSVYGVSNNAYTMEITDWESCEQLDRVSHNIGQSLITKIYHQGTDAPYMESNHSYYEGNSSGMESLIGLSDNIEALDGSELDALSFIIQDFNNSDHYNANSWTRTMNEYSSTDFYDGTQTVSRHNSDDVYTVQTFYPDGTNSKLCGTWSSGGSDLVDCTDRH